MTPSFSLIQFRDWARTKPADERYTYSNRLGCALCLFLKDTGRAVTPEVHVDGWWIDLDGPAEGHAGKVINDAVESCETFGELADKLSDTWTSPAAYLSDIEQVVS